MVLMWEFRKVAEKIMRPGQRKKQLYLTSERLSCLNLTWHFRGTDLPRYLPVLSWQWQKQNQHITAEFLKLCVCDRVV